MNYKQVIQSKDLSYSDVARTIGVSYDTLKRFLKDPSNKNRKYVADALDRLFSDELNLDENAELTSKVDSKGHMEATVKHLKNSAHGKSLDEMVILFKVDPLKWICTSYVAKQWDVTGKIKQKDGTHKWGTETNFGATAKFAPVNKRIVTKEDIGWIFDQTNSMIKHSVLPELGHIKGDNILVLPIFDAHIGKLAWGKETGENYDIKIGIARFKKAVRNLVSRANSTGFEKIIFPIGNDFFQVDNDKSETTRGTQVDSDIRWKKLFKLGVDLLRDTLNYCVTFAPVDVILVQGNHDTQMSFYAFEALRGWYDDHPYIKISSNIRTRTYRQIGVNLLGFTHGDKEKDRLYEIMQQEARHLWGKTRYSEWIVGHYHRSYVDEKQGVRKRVVSSISGKDAWHYESGYDSLTAAQAIIYNKKQLGPYEIYHISFDEKV